MYNKNEIFWYYDEWYRYITRRTDALNQATFQPMVDGVGKDNFPIAVCGYAAGKQGFLELFLHDPNNPDRIIQRQRHYIKLKHGSKMEYSINTEYTRRLIEWRNSKQREIEFQKQEKQRQKQKKKYDMYQQLLGIDGMFVADNPNEIPFHVNLKIDTFNPFNQSQALRVYLTGFMTGMESAYSAFFHEGTVFEITFGEHNHMTEIIKTKQVAFSDMNLHAERPKRTDLRPLITVHQVNPQTKEFFPIQKQPKNQEKPKEVEKILPPSFKEVNRMEKEEAEVDIFQKLYGNYRFSKTLQWIDTNIMKRKMKSKYYPPIPPPVMAKKVIGRAFFRPMINRPLISKEFQAIQ
jgi:hypothetical protein